MKKIPTIFERDPNQMSRVLDKPNPECAWVFQGEGVATGKLDGTCCMISDGKLYKRRVVKQGQQAPPGFIPAEETVPGYLSGWLPVGDGPEDAIHREALIGSGTALLADPADGADGTYELIGPRIQGNPERLTGHMLLPHAGAQQYPDAPRTFDGLAAWFANEDIEGLVWHHPDGRMAKIKQRDFGMRRKPTAPSASP